MKYSTDKLLKNDKSSHDLPNFQLLADQFQAEWLLRPLPPYLNSEII